MNKPSILTRSGRFRAQRCPSRTAAEPLLVRFHSAGPDPLAAQAALVGRLERALRAERARGRAGHATYDLARHASLAHALKNERERLSAMRREALRREPRGPAARSRTDGPASVG
jgi:hypothetical protein